MRNKRSEPSADHTGVACLTPGSSGVNHSTASPRRFHVASHAASEAVAREMARSVPSTRSCQPLVRPIVPSVNGALLADVGLGRGDPDGVGVDEFAVTETATSVVPSMPLDAESSSVVPAMRRASPADRTSVARSGAPLDDGIGLGVGANVADPVAVAVGDARWDTAAEPEQQRVEPPAFHARRNLALAPPVGSRGRPVVETRAICDPIIPGDDRGHLPAHSPPTPARSPLPCPAMPLVLRSIPNIDLRGTHDARMAHDVGHHLLG